MTASGVRVLVVHALPDAGLRWEIELPAGATVADSLHAARVRARADGIEEQIDWDTSPVGIYGLACERSRVLEEGDRVEIYRPLLVDPRERRRERVSRSRARRPR
jgi:hypothetical protein